MKAGRRFEIGGYVLFQRVEHRAIRCHYSDTIVDPCPQERRQALLVLPRPVIPHEDEASLPYGFRRRLFHSGGIEGVQAAVAFQVHAALHAVVLGGYPYNGYDHPPYHRQDYHGTGYQEDLHRAVHDGAWSRRLITIIQENAVFFAEKGREGEGPRSQFMTANSTSS